MSELSPGDIAGVEPDGTVSGTSVQASEVLDEMVTVLDKLASRPRSIGYCGSFAGTGLVALSLGGCVLFDGDYATVVGFGGIGLGVAVELTASSGPIVSNADHHSQILKGSICVGGSGVYEMGISGELCFSLNDDQRSLSGIWTFYGAVSIGGAAEVHIIYTQTEEVFSLNLPCVGGWDLPVIPEVDLPGFLPTVPGVDLPKFPSLGCA
jgi:hypothetical protein